jgi:hypothetical protein
MEERRTISREDIAEIKSDGKLTLGLARSIAMDLAVHNTKQLNLEAKVEKLDLVIFGAGTGDDPGYIARANMAAEKLNARIDAVVSTQNSYSRVMWIIITPLLGTLGVGIFYLINHVLAAK